LPQHLTNASIHPDVHRKTGTHIMHVKDKICVVTGAASGIGEAMARGYAQAGARGVVVAESTGLP
jgi:hypothetical protein